ncbi:MAG: hypothetical protein E2O50_05390 [Gammaproteobacteria bacterium]|nr:MAG: hypothetical protein E2O50_05390 [Gammaproteobacteria bacterium]
MKKYGLLLISIVLLSPLAVTAKEKPEWRSWPLGDRLIGTVGYYKPTLDTKAVVSDSDGNLGALISFEETLGLSDNKGTAIAAIAWRISKRNSLTMNYFKLSRDATQNSEVGIFITNPMPPPESIEVKVTLPITAAFDIESIDLSYAFSIIFTEKMNLAVGIGLALQELTFGLQASDDCTIPACSDFGAPRTVSSTVPLPTINFLFQYAINDKWIIDTNIGYLDVELELEQSENLGGRIINLTAGIRWKTWDHFGFNLAYKLFDVEIDYAKRNLRAAAEYKYKGFMLGMQGFY